MLVATILSAQCTDKRVNEITKTLFKDHPNLTDYVNMDINTLIKYIRSAGFYNSKAKNIIGAAKIIHSDFSGNIPKSIKDLVTIPGVARKTANVVLANAFGISEGIAVDTHVKRLSFRLGFTQEKNPVKIERDLMAIFSRNKWIKITYLLIEHGRAVCKAPVPLCSKCPITEICPRKGINKHK
jgi:endonuclease-3